LPGVKVKTLDQDPHIQTRPPTGRIFQPGARFLKKRWKEGLLSGKKKE